MILLAEHAESSLAAKKRRQPGASSTATSTPKTRVWDFENAASGRPCSDLDLSWETATGSVQFTYESASGRAEWLSRDPIAEAGGINLYGYVGNNPISKIDPLGLNPGDILPSGAGIQITGTVDVGVPTANGMVMAGATGSLGLGNFYNSTTGQSSTGTFNSAGAFQHLPGVPPSNYPSSGGMPGGQCPFSAGAHAGFGPGVFLTNAGNVDDLKGPFNQYNLNIIGINISLGLSSSNGVTTYIVGVSLPNAGLAVSGYPTTTTVLSNSAPPGSMGPMP